MYMIIVGAGIVGRSLAELAIRNGHDIAIIDREQEDIEATTQGLDALVLQADIAKDGILEEAGAEKAKVLVACTADDSANLMAMFLAQEYRIAVRVSIVNVASHKPMFERLGVHVLMDPEEIVARHLYGLILWPQVKDVVTLPEGAQVFQIVLGEASVLVGESAGQAAEDKLLDQGLQIVHLKRGDKRVVPRRDTRLEPGDELTVFAETVPDDRTLSVFTG